MANDTGFDALYINDDEYTATAPQILQKVTRIQEIWDEYISISEQIVSTQGVIAGSRAKAYSEFISVAKQHLGEKLLTIAAESEKDMKTYIEMIDAADSVLY